MRFIIFLKSTAEIVINSGEPEPEVVIVGSHVDRPGLLQVWFRFVGIILDVI